MSELLKLLDGTADEVKTGIAGKSRDDLQALRAAEQDGKTRKSVLEALDAAISVAAGAAAATSGGSTSDTALSPTLGTSADTSGPANIAPATDFAPSGAPMQTVPDVDPNHPAVDANPRERTTELQNRIDFNDPTISGSEAVEQNLRDQAAA